MSKENEFTNMSDGVNDGFVLFYVKDENVYPIALTKEQMQMLDIVIPTALGSKVNIVDMPMATVKNLKDENNG